MQTCSRVEIISYIKTLSKDDQYMALIGRHRAKRGAGNIAPVAHFCRIPSKRDEIESRPQRMLVPVVAQTLAERYAKMKADPSKYEKFKEYQRAHYHKMSARNGRKIGRGRVASPEVQMRKLSLREHRSKNHMYQVMFRLCEVHHCERILRPQGGGKFARRCPMCERQSRKDSNRGHRRRGHGRVMASDYNAVMDRDRQCLKCGSVSGLTVDHIRPVAHGGSGRINNLQVLCNLCNGCKQDTEVDYRNPSVQNQYGAPG